MQLSKCNQASFDDHWCEAFSFETGSDQVLEAFPQPDRNIYFTTL